jgi:MarR family transcriptional regulator, organic hydroperoxide resistance regulator
MADFSDVNPLRLYLARYILNKKEAVMIDSDKLSRKRELKDFLCFSIYEAGHAFNQLYGKLLSDLGLTYPQYLVMTLLWRSDDRTVTAIGQELGLKSNTLTPLLKRLEGSGLVLRRRDAKDERVVRISLTKSGTELYEHAKMIPRYVSEATGMSANAIHDLINKLDSLRSKIAKATGG